MNNRIDWLKERRSGLGGSDMAAVLGVSPWRTPVNVWLDKTGQTPVEDGEGSITLRIGNELEDMVARLYTEEKGLKVQRYKKVIHDGCLLGNVDRLVVMPGQKIASLKGEVRTKIGLECKTTSQPVWNEVPIYYLTQVYHYMGLIPCIDKFDIACLFLLGKDFRVYPVERDQEIIDNLRQRGEEFWNKYVVPKVMPPPVNEDDCKLLWQRSNPGKTVETNETITGIVERIKELKSNLKQGEKELKPLEDAVKAYMGDSEILAGVSGKPMVTWKTSKDRTTVDWKGVASELGASDEQISKYTTTKPGSRTFLIK